MNFLLQLSAIHDKIQAQIKYICVRILIKRVGDCMGNRELAKVIIVSRGGVAKSADFVAAGIRAVDVVNMCNAGYLERVRHGYYSLAGESIVSEEQLLATLVPQGIVCAESALFYYGYSDFAPRSTWRICSSRSARWSL